MSQNNDDAERCPGNETVRKNSFKAWFLASRPKTLSAGATPVIVASALAWHDGNFQAIPASICLAFALLAQIVSNFANDYFDYLKGSDTPERSGPKRAVAEGWIAPNTMIFATLSLCVLNSVVGLALIRYGGWLLIWVGAAVVVFALAYSGGPYPLAYHGWGDACVLVFFGIVPVGFTYYVQTGTWTFATTISGIAVGLVVADILVANNYRDRFSDAASGKNTTVVLFGEHFGRRFYLFNGFSAVACCQFFWFDHSVGAAALPMLYLPVHIATWRKMVRIDRGEALVVVLEHSARNALIFGILLSAGLLLP